MPECKTCEGVGEVPESDGSGGTIIIDCPDCCGTGVES